MKDQKASISSFDNAYFNAFSESTYALSFMKNALFWSEIIPHVMKS